MQAIGTDFEVIRMETERKRTKALADYVKENGPIPLAELFDSVHFGRGLDVLYDHHSFADKALEYTHQVWATAVGNFIKGGWGYVFCENPGTDDARFVLTTYGWREWHRKKKRKCLSA